MRGAASFDGESWLRRWDAMQTAYVPDRARRFDVLLTLPDLDPDGAWEVLDLGCGPGSLSLAALERFPQAHVVAVDADPAMLAIGRSVAAARGLGGRLTFMQADLRAADWWAPYGGRFHLAVSATALHWLTAEHLAVACGRLWRILRPGGWFLNSDHVAADDPATQARYHDLLAARQAATFSAGNVEDWDTYESALHAALGPDGAAGGDTWEGSDDGHPLAWHRATLAACGFGQVAVHWQDLGEMIIGARRP